MHDAIKLACSLYLVKQATPRWAKMLAGLSDAARARLATYLPAGKTRIIGKEFDRGAEGAIFPSFTGGGVGETVTKVFYDRPALMAIGPVPELGRITGGSAGIKKTLGNVDVATRAELMKNHPKIFPEIYSTNPRGYTMEVLEPIFGGHPGTQRADFLNKIRWEKRKLKYAQQNIRDLADAMLHVQRSGNSAQTSMARKVLQDAANRKKEEVLQLREAINNLFRDRHAYSSDRLIDSSIFGTLNRELRGRNAQPTRNPLFSDKMQPVFEFKGKNYGVADAGLRRSGLDFWHNVMQRPGGGAVISDPVLFSLKDIKSFKPATGAFKRTTSAPVSAVTPILPTNIPGWTSL